MTKKLYGSSFKLPKPVTVDFETFGIESRPDYPPKPTGISIKYPGKPARYYAFGHARHEVANPTKAYGLRDPKGFDKNTNNCTEAEARAATAKAWKWKGGILCQNGKFDVDVAEEHWDLKVPKWSDVHDTMFLIFLDDPNQPTFSLKPAAARLLGMKPDEQDAVGDWLVEHQPVPGVKISKSQRSEHYFGRYIAFAPGWLVAKYADGDTIRTERLFTKLWSKTKKRNMLEAYDRERKLMPILLQMERQGLPIHYDKLGKDLREYERWLEKINAWVLKRLHLERVADFNLDSGDQLFEAMRKAKKVDLKKAPLTPTGKFQTSKDALLQCVKDKELLAVLKYRTQLKTCLQTFMRPWHATATKVIERGLRTKSMAKEGKSLIFTTWNQVKGDARGGNVGARTGRLSATPNFQNIPKVFAFIFAHEERHLKKSERKGLAKCPIKGLPPLPNCRAYIAPFPGHTLIDRDYSQQEPRILAHFDGGSLLKKYQEQPWIDFHDYARAELAKAGLFYERKPVKNTNLGLIYGMGTSTLAERNGMDVKEAQKLKQAILRLYPGLKEMYREAKRRAAENIPVRTWGGREYYCEPPKIVEGKWRHFDYKLVNVLIQGSAADCTKEAIIRYWEAKDPLDLLLLNVHDQLTSSTPKARRKAAMAILKEAMESIEFDVTMLTEGSESEESWAALEDTDKKGQPVRKAA